MREAREVADRLDGKPGHAIEMQGDVNAAAVAPRVSRREQSARTGHSFEA
jgi:hypothetical protein